MCIQRLQALLDAHDVPYETMTHEPCYTSYQLAHRTKVPPRDVAKTVIVAVDGRLAMVVLPGCEWLDLDQLKAASGAREVCITSEDDYKIAFPDCEVGAMPPFGNLYDMPVFVSESLRGDEQIVFNAGTHTQMMRIAYDDFERVVDPVVAPLSAA
ncbi:MAG: aminoacyl-tRNA deacylase [Phycisphaeraceae bacterium]